MKILHVVPTAGWAGSERIAFSFAAYQSLHHRVAVVVKNGPGFSDLFYRNKLPSNVQIIAIDQNLKSQQEINAFVRKSLEFVPDIVHAHLSLGCRIAKSLKTSSNVLIGHMHVRFFALQFKEMDAVVAVSPWQMEDIPVWYQGGKKLVRNFVADRKGCKGVDIGRFKRRFYIDASAYVIGTVGRLHIEKGIDTLIKAFMKANIKQSRLLIIGDGPAAEKLRSLAGGHPDIIFTGFLDNASDYMSAFNLYVSPSRADSFGLAVLEALAQDVPVLASATYGSRDMLGNSDRIFEIDNHDELACKLKMAFSSKLKNPVPVGEFDEQMSNQSLLDFYEKLLSVRMGVASETCQLTA